MKVASVKVFLQAETIRRCFPHSDHYEEQPDNSPFKSLARKALRQFSHLKYWETLSLSHNIVSVNAID